jgi:hypothetical protein
LINCAAGVKLQYPGGPPYKTSLIIYSIAGKNQPGISKKAGNAKESLKRTCFFPKPKIDYDEDEESPTSFRIVRERFPAPARSRIPGPRRT